MLCSGTISEDWSLGFSDAHTECAYISALDVPLTSALFVCTATSYAPDAVNQLCGIKFGTPEALPVMPVATCTQGAGIETNAIYYMLAGGLLSNATAELTLTYQSATALTTIAPKVLPDPISGQYPSSFTYEVFVDGVSKGQQAVAPDASTALSIAINATGSVVKIVMTAVGTCIVADCLPSGTMQSGVLPAIVDVFIMDVTHGNLTKVPHVVTASGILLQPAMLVPQWGP